MVCLFEVVFSKYFSFSFDVEIFEAMWSDRIVDFKSWNAEKMISLIDFAKERESEHTRKMSCK